LVDFCAAAAGSLFLLQPADQTDRHKKFAAATDGDGWLSAFVFVLRPTVQHHFCCCTTQTQITYFVAIYDLYSTLVLYLFLLYFVYVLHTFYFYLVDLDLVAY